MNTRRLSRKVSESIHYFQKDTQRRCTKIDKHGNKTCTYSGTTLGIKSKGCAVGMLLDQKTRLAIDKVCRTGMGISTVLKYVKNGVGTPYYPFEQELNIPVYIQNNKELFSRLQTLHDDDDNWNSTGLSRQGQQRLSSMIQMFDLERSYFEDLLQED